MGRHILIALSRNSVMEFMLCCLGVILLYCNRVGACFPEVSMMKGRKSSGSLCVY